MGAIKSQNFKGFGSPAIGKFKWFCIEYLDKEEELVELHWIKVREVESTFVEDVFLACCQDLKHSYRRSEIYGFLALMHLGVWMESQEAKDKGIYFAYLFPANRKGDTAIRLPSGNAIGNNHGYSESPQIQRIALNYCVIDEIVPAEFVSLTNRRLNKWKQEENK